ncbi:uncharacterized protein EI90DRAFT_3019426 [Cantharellus anzutake]|uniref:uncharacterized protein n=1 Tax=Cantharellus anzutake TaxID=1750568 RepID=UPI00190456A8|nr:uncharacterized protein EI90DRAFT_3019426 [Cantharellus anzutake]KAF8324662.1 hypothetical protein EI90DRAFT_3019426 [Cantharellus anzutake]
MTELDSRPDMPIIINTVPPNFPPSALESGEQIIHLDTGAHSMVVGHIDLILANLYRALAFIALKTGVDVSQVSLLPLLVGACISKFQIGALQLELAPGLGETPSLSGGPNNEAALQQSTDSSDTSNAETALDPGSSFTLFQHTV